MVKITPAPVKPVRRIVAFIIVIVLLVAAQSFAQGSWYDEVMSVFVDPPEMARYKDQPIPNVNDVPTAASATRAEPTAETLRQDQLEALRLQQQAYVPTNDTVAAMINPPEPTPSPAAVTATYQAGLDSFAEFQRNPAPFQPYHQAPYTPVREMPQPNVATTNVLDAVQHLEMLPSPWLKAAERGTGTVYAGAPTWSQGDEMAAAPSAVPMSPMPEVWTEDSFTPAAPTAVNALSGIASGTTAAVIFFGHGSKRLDAEDHAVLDDLASVLLANPRGLVVIGHASQRSAQRPLRSRLLNYQISLQRAEAVATYLASRGVPRDWLNVSARGDAAVLYDENTPNAEAWNRRVEILLR